MLQHFKTEPIAYKDLLITHLEQKGLRLWLWKDLDTPHKISKLKNQFIFVNNK